jgi:toxin ParE1/3/4
VAEIVWSESALLDLNEIAEYIALDKPNAAKKLVKNVFSAVGRLEEHPESGRYPPELSDRRYKEVIVGPCRVFHRIDSEKGKVFILYVMRGDRALRKFILNDRSDENS